MFPIMYEKEVERDSVSLHLYNKNFKNTKDVSQDKLLNNQMRLPTNIQCQFSIGSDTYQMDMNLAQYSTNSNHVPKIYWNNQEQNDKGELIDSHLELMIELSVPAAFVKKNQNGDWINVVSPL